VWQLNPNSNHQNKRLLSKRLILTMVMCIVAAACLIGLYVHQQQVVTAQPLQNMSLANNSLAFITKQIHSTVNFETINDFTICIGGDVNLAAEMSGYIKAGHKPFAGVQKILDDCTLNIINLETNVADANVGRRQAKNYAFKAPPFTLQALVDAGVDVVSLANNHTMDYGPDALVDQFKHLKSYKIKYFGAGSNSTEAFAPLFLEINNTKIALVAFNDAETRIGNVRSNRAGSAYFNTALTGQTLAQAKSLANIVIALPHWGIEHQPRNSAKQQQWGRFLVDRGADLVVGAHPHVRQNIEDYKGKKIFYSIGNFVFSGFAGRPEAEKAMLLKVTIRNKQILKIDTIQLQINYFGFPTPI
jgi:poly-gamma-glutamate capsule biosynthesis protein CapA/YwtB (metallophosphatase superfamily)